MHISGIIFAWLAVPAALAAAYFSARLIDTRNAWAERVEAYREHNEEYAKLIASKKTRLNVLRKDLERSMTGWGQAWSGVNVTVDPASGNLAASNVGTNVALGGTDATAAKTPKVHVFSPQAEGDWRYVGWFEATPRENDTRLAPMWSLLPGETDAWTPGAWRIREMVPSFANEQIPPLYLEYTKKQERIADSQQKVAEKQQLLVGAEADLQTRVDELVGDDPNANPPVEGLVPAIRKEQKLRDEAEAEVDRLRREVQAAQQKLEQLAAENVELTTGKPGVKPVAAADSETESN